MSHGALSWRAALAAYADGRVRAMLFLGFSAGLPFLLVFSTLSAWLAQAGVSRTAIGLFSWVGITYSVKVFWAPVVDRLPLPMLTRRLGRRRGWMLLAQAGIATGLLTLAHSDPATHLAAVAGLSLAVAFCAATQDIAIDAWRIEIAPPEWQGALSAAYQLGYRLALITAGAGALFIAAAHGWKTAYTVMAACMGLGLLTTLLIREPVCARDRDAWLREQRVVDFLAAHTHLPPRWRTAQAWFIGAVICPFTDFFARHGGRLGAIILLFIGLFRVTDITMGVMANPFYLDRGYSLEQVAAIAKGYGVLMSILGAFIGGTLVARWGTGHTLLLGGALVILSNLGFAALALSPQPGLAALSLVISADNLSAGIAGSAFIAYLSGLTSRAYTATQYALFSSLFTLPGKLLAGASGWVVETLGYPGFFVYTSALGLPALALASWLVRRDRAAAR